MEQRRAKNPHASSSRSEDSSDQGTWSSGTLINNRYLIEKELGRGGIGLVYLARDQQLHLRPVVIKILLEKAYQDPWIKRKFLQEMEALSRIDHPGIVALLDAGESDQGKPYIVMQYIDGVTLRSLMRVEGMDLRHAAGLIRQIGEALSFAHDKGVVHRDLKPENIMVQSSSTGAEQVKLIDFGLAKVLNSSIAESTSMPNVAGSFSYMAPEQLRCKPSGIAADIFSLGVIVYEMVTGRRPFNPDSVFELLEMQKAGVRLKPTDLRPSLPPASEDVILKAISVDPKNRYSKARDFCTEFAQSLTAETETVSDHSVIPRPNEEMSRRKTETTEYRLAAAWLSLMINLTLILVFLKIAFFRFLSWETYILRRPASYPLILGVLAFGLPPLISFVWTGRPWNASLLKMFASRRHLLSPVKIIVSYAFAGLLSLGIIYSPKVIEISSVHGRILPHSENRFTLNYSDPKGYKYKLIDSSFCSVSINPTWLNHLSDYSIRLSLSPDIEFADVYFERSYAVPEQLFLEPSNSSDILVLTKSNDDFRNTRKILFTYKYRKNPTQKRIHVSLISGETQIVDERELFF